MIHALIRGSRHSLRMLRKQTFAWIDTAAADARYAVRGLRAAPAFTAVVILSLALGIGANTAIFTLINVAMLKPLPVSHPEELVQLTTSGGEPSKGPSPFSFSQAMWERIRDEQDVFAGVIAYGSTGSGDLSTGGESRPIPVGLVSGGFFATLGVRPVVGRMLVDADDQPGCAGVAVLTHAFWQREYSGDPGIVGTSVPINGRPFEIVGVADARFFGLGFGYYPPVWVPQCAGVIVRGPTYTGGGAIIARLKPGATLDQSAARMEALAPGILESTVPAGATAEAAARHLGIRFGVTPFARGFPFLRMDYGEALLILMGVVGVVLLIACANIANLLLARATARQREIAVRMALGASRSRLIRQLLTESMLLSVLGAGLGMLFAAWGSGVLVGLLSRGSQPLVQELAPDARVLAFTIAATVLTGLIFGLAPAWRAVRGDPQAAMNPGARGLIEGQSRFGAGKALIVAQIALSFVMITGAGLLVGSWRRLATMDPGFRSEGVLLVTVNSRAASIADNERGATFQRVLERLRALPGVTDASAANRTPLGTTGWSAPVEVAGFDPGPEGNRVVQLNEVSDRYFATIGARFLRGRDFGRGEVPAAPAAAIVNDEMTRKFFAGRAALGQQFKIRGGRDGETTYEIVGVVADTKDEVLHEPNQPLVYLALGQNAAPEPYINFAVRGAGSASSLAGAVATAITEIGPRFSLTTRTLQAQVDESVRLPRTLGVLSGFFGALALLLASIGLYGIMSYTVGRRRKEIGVRIALGAAQLRIFRMVLGDVGRMLAVGLAIGISLSLAITRLVSAFLFGVEPNDPLTFALSGLILAAVATGAAMMPARRAAKLDPVAVLRED
jgi:predicted permease